MMLDIGEKLRNARHDQKLSLRDLATKAEVSPSLLSQIENGKANPSVVTLYNIATALSVPLDYFFPGDHSSVPHSETTPVNMMAGEFQASRDSSLANGTDEIFERDGRRPDKRPLVRAHERPTIELMGGVTWARLTAEAEENIEFLEIVYAPGASSGAVMSHHAGREFGLVLDGALMLELGFERYTLRAGDSIIFDSKTPHRLVNNDAVPLRALWVVFNR